MEVEGEGCRELYIESRWLYRTLGMRVGVFVQWIGVALPTLVIGSRVRIVLW